MTGGAGSCCSEPGEDFSRSPSNTAMPPLKPNHRTPTPPLQYSPPPLGLLLLTLVHGSRKARALSTPPGHIHLCVRKRVYALVYPCNDMHTYLGVGNTQTLGYNTLSYISKTPTHTCCNCTLTIHSKVMLEYFGSQQEYIDL